MWQKAIYDNVKILCADSSGKIQYRDFSTVSSRTSDYLGIALLDCGRIIMPLNLNLKWGANDRMYTSASETQGFYTLEKSGRDRSEAKYNASEGNRGNDCAIGFAHNYSRVVNGKGIGEGSWFVPHPYECLRYLLPNWNKVAYVTELLLGFTLNTYCWTCEDAASTSGYRFSATMGNVLSTSKTNSDIGLILMAELQNALETIS